MTGKAGYELESGELERNFGGELIRPHHPGYDAARMVHNAMFDRRPVLIARCHGVADVQAALRFAREHDLLIAVRGGGHAISGTSICDDGLVIDLGPMKGIRVDPRARTVRAEAGLTWGELDRETQAFGLATTGGRVTTTGIAGLTLGSGSGWLERTHGWTIDNLLSVDLVTADGRLVSASADEQPELFWGLRGGGGNFGIATSFEYRLHPVGPELLGGILLFPTGRAGAVLRAWRDAMAQAPDELGGAAAVITAPPEPFVPAELRGRPACALVVCWFGAPERAERAVEPLRALRPAADLVGPIPYTALQALLDPMMPRGLHSYWKSDLMDELADPAIDAFLRHALAAPSPLTLSVLEPKGGAIARLDEDATALGGRDAAFTVYALAQWAAGADPEPNIEWARAMADAMRPFTRPGVALNFVGDEGEERVRSSYGPEKYARLVALKDAFDPGNVFRMNQNIRPSKTAHRT
jgi:FAD/FMN-containing dehydrogenase